MKDIRLSDDVIARLEEAVNGENADAKASAVTARVYPIECAGIYANYAPEEDVPRLGGMTTKDGEDVVALTGNDSDTMIKLAAMADADPSTIVRDDDGRITHFVAKDHEVVRMVPRGDFGLAKSSPDKGPKRCTACQALAAKGRTANRNKGNSISNFRKALEAYQTAKDTIKTHGPEGDGLLNETTLETLNEHLDAAVDKLQQIAKANPQVRDKVAAVAPELVS